MNQASGRSLDRVGAAAGFAAVTLLVTMIAVLPALPGPDRPIAEITASAIDDRGSLLLGSYLGSLMAGALLVFGAAVAAVVRRASPDSGWWIVALVGIAGTAAVGIVSNALVVAFVRAVEHGARGESLWIGYSGDHALGTLITVPLGIFLLGAGFGARASGALPRWLTWVAVGWRGRPARRGWQHHGGRTGGRTARHSTCTRLSRSSRLDRRHERRALARTTGVVRGDGGGYRALAAAVDRDG